MAPGGAPLAKIRDALPGRRQRRTYLSPSAPLLYCVKTLSIEIDMGMLAIKALAVLALALVGIAPSSAREDNQCYSSCKARCVARYACEGRHPGPNCFTNFNKCRASCWRMCRHLSGLLSRALDHRHPAKRYPSNKAKCERDKGHSHLFPT